MIIFCLSNFLTERLLRKLKQNATFQTKLSSFVLKQTMKFTDLTWRVVLAFACEFARIIYFLKQSKDEKLLILLVTRTAAAVCDDTATYCSDTSAVCFHTIYEQIMTKECKSSCGICSGTTVPPPVVGVGHGYKVKNG